ncbi:DUF3078 domain-containing protein [Bizionia gelidisalsuginis]|uniref:DUF3078 domain-containing protein n=2 Tax=Bizionia TaxID=283785 RepID=A0A8H2LFE5_9FLAO|nr:MULTISPECIES: DUF3078 domain-containing protein [Bizionia]TYB80318.1 DUF3078 domain-containing protein [Bizionia saleffrena]TYC17161.1 DUF3078 domain-containing protein [Bizionia gelidisalsuginis]
MRVFILLLTLCISINVGAQENIITVKSEQEQDSIVQKDSIKTWTNKNKVGLDLSEVTFVNWNAGGSNSISALSGFITNLDYKKDKITWKNRAVIRLGGNKQESQKLRKTDDVLEISSKFGYQKDTLSNWYYSARFNFKSQFLHGYSYPNRDNPISKFMAPGYSFVGAGAEYGKNIEKMSLYLSPLTYKGTIVLDRDLSNAGSFGVEPAVYDDNGNTIREGERVRSELGILITSAYETNLFENIDFKSLIELYTDYVNSFGNVDVNWELLVNFKVNDYVKTALGSHLIYDDDISTYQEIDGMQVEKGPKMQWKQILGVGVIFDF